MELRAEEGSAQQNTILRGRLPRHAAVWVDHFTICVLNSVQFRMILSTLLETKQLIWFATCVVNCTCPLLAMITILYSPTFVPYEGHLTYDVSLFFNKYVTCDRNQNFRRWPTRSSRSYFLRTPDHNHTAAAKAVWGACRDCCRDGSAAGRAFFFFWTGTKIDTAPEYRMLGALLLNNRSTDCAIAAAMLQVQTCDAHYLHKRSSKLAVQRNYSPPVR